MLAAMWAAVVGVFLSFVGPWLAELLEMVNAGA